MDCPKCGTHNRDDAERCRLCGNPMREGPRIVTAEQKVCQFCKTVNDKAAPFCAGCRRPMGRIAADMFDEEKRMREIDNSHIYTDYATGPARTARSGVAGIILLMIVGFVAIDMAFTTFIFVDFSRSETYQDMVADNSLYRTAVNNILACQVLRLIFVIMTALGAIAAVRRLNFGLAIAGGAFGIMSLGTSVLALVGGGWWFWLSVMLFVADLIALGFIVYARRDYRLA